MTLGERSQLIHREVSLSALAVLCGCPAQCALEQSMLVGGFLRGDGFLTLPAKFAGPAAPDRQIQRDLEDLATWVGRPEAVVHRARYYIATAACWAMISIHYTLLPIRLERSNPCLTARVRAPYEYMNYLQVVQVFVRTPS
jgi:hypothetical protein